jgi:hypothetical protein
MKPGPGWIYLVGEDDTDYCKVGMTQGDLAPRVHKLQTGNPRQLELLDAVHGDIHVERALHAALLPYRVKREWFRPVDLVKLIFSNLQEALLDEAEGLCPTYQAVTDYWEAMPVNARMVEAAARHSIAYWESPARIEDEAEFEAFERQGIWPAPDRPDVDFFAEAAGVPA